MGVIGRCHIVVVVVAVLDDGWMVHSRLNLESLPIENMRKKTIK